MQFLKPKSGRKVEERRPITTTSKTARIILIIFTLVMVFVSFYFSRTLEKYITDQKSNIVVDLIAKQAEKHLEHIDISTPLTFEMSGKFQQVFSDLNTELSNSLHIISTMKLFSPEGELLWSSIPSDELGTYYDAMEVSQALREGSYIGEASESDESKNTISLFARILNEEQVPIAVIEVYFARSDIDFYNQNIGMVLGGITIATIIIIYCFLFFTFRAQDNKLISQSIELQQMISQSPVGIYTIDTDGYIETYNPAMMRISGITDLAQTIGKNVFDAEGYKKSGLDKMLREGLSGVPFETEAEIESSLGGHKRTWRHYYGVPIRNSSQDVIRLLVMVEDITVRKELETRVREYGATLEKKIQERTALLEEKISQLERFERLTVDRELRMVELKQEIETMRVKLESKTDRS